MRRLLFLSALIAYAFTCCPLSAASPLAPIAEMATAQPKAGPFELTDSQRRRFEGTELACNADMGPAEVRQYCEVDQAGKSLLRAAMQQLVISTRAYHRILKLARTIADLTGSERIETAHLAEAIQYRPRRQT